MHDNGSNAIWYNKSVVSKTIMVMRGQQSASFFCHLLKYFTAVEQEGCCPCHTSALNAERWPSSSSSLAFWESSTSRKKCCSFSGGREQGKSCCSFTKERQGSCVPSCFKLEREFPPGRNCSKGLYKSKKKLAQL